MTTRIARVSFFAASLLLAGWLLSASSLAQTGQSIEQIKKQIEALKARAADQTAWSPEMKSAFEQSLKALNLAYEKAIVAEIEKLTDLLTDITDQTARKPLEERLNGLKKLLIAAEVERLTDLLTVITDPAARKPLEERLSELKKLLPTPATPPPAAASTSSGACLFTLRIHARVKGTGYPVRDAHAKLLKLKPASDPPEYGAASAFTCFNERCNTDKDGLLTIQLSCSKDTYKVALQKDPYHPAFLPDVIIPSKKGTTSINIELTPRDDDFYRAIVGFEQTGISSAQSQQNLFMNLFTSRPLLRGHFYTECYQGTTVGFDECRPPRNRIWGDIRLTSVPQQKQKLFQTLNGSLANALSNRIDNLSDLEIGVSFLAGYQRLLFPGFIAGNRFDISLIAGGGAAVPLAPERNVQIYKIPDATTDKVRLDSLKGRLKEIDPNFTLSTLDGKKSIAFVQKERDRFMRNYFGGLRFEIYYGDTSPIRPPGIFDLTIGQDESVTGGKLRGSVLRLDGFFPLPVSRGDLIYLFGTANLGLKRAKVTDPLLLPAADGTQTATSAETIVVPVPAASRDLYRLGIGINLLRVFK